MVDIYGTVASMSDRDRVAQAICRADPANIGPDGVFLDVWEDCAEAYLAMADAALEAMKVIQVTGSTSQTIALPDTTDTTKRGTRLADNWVPSPTVRADLIAQYPHLNFTMILEEFKDYWCAVPGQRGLKLSWDRTFRNRVREVAHKPQYRRQGIGMQGGGQMSKVDLKAMSYLEGQ